MSVKIHSATQGMFTVDMDDRFAGRILNDRGRWTFRAASKPAGDADGGGPLRGSDGIDVTSAIHSDDLGDVLTGTA